MKKNRLNSKTYETHLPKIMENVLDVESFSPTFSAFHTNTNRKKFHNDENIFTMLIKRVKLLRVFTFYFVYFLLNANIVKKGAHIDMTTVAH